MNKKAETVNVNQNYTPVSSMNTPLPWRVEPTKGTLCAWIIASESRPTVAFVAQTVGNNQEENSNAELIVRACNAHDELLTACKAALSKLPYGNESIDQMCSKAIAKAEGRS